jgi:hypothetical protein
MEKIMFKIIKKLLLCDLSYTRLQINPVQVKNWVTNDKRHMKSHSKTRVLLNEQVQKQTQKKLAKSSNFLMWTNGIWV